VFSSTLAYAPIRLSVAGTTQSRPVNGAFVSGAFFECLGVAPAFGRPLNKTVDSLSAAPVVVISHSYWQGQFGGNPQILGQQIVVDGVPATITGVAPATFFGLELGSRADIYVPMALEPRLHPGSKLLTTSTNYWLKGTTSEVRAFPGRMDYARVEHGWTRSTAVHSVGIQRGPELCLLRNVYNDAGRDWHTHQAQLDDADQKVKNEL
jgi:hypothetical protein